MDFSINGDELTVLSGLPHLQQLVYFRGIRPYMDVKTGIVGIKRGISLQSIAEQLYIEPCPGIKSENFSRAQVRRALSALTRVGIISNHSKDLQLILKCPLATRDYSVQNKAVTNPSQQVVTATNSQPIEIQQNFRDESRKADIGEMAKAVTPLKEKNYIYLLSQFEKFWACYPEKKSGQNAWQVFQRLNPDQVLLNKMLEALTAQIKHREEKQLHGIWVPPWKYPANWLTQRCWEDELSTELLQEQHHAEHTKNTKSRDTNDMFCPPCDTEERETNNVIPFKQYR